MIIDGNGTLSEIFTEIQKNTLPDFCIEVGAHAAEFSMEMSNLFGIKAVAFEASPDVFNLHKDANNTDLVSYVNHAISDITGTVTFKVHQDLMAGNNSIKDRVGASTMKSYEVECSRLDDYLKDYAFSSACLWIDVEGANQEVLTGAVETLKRCKSIFIETEDFSFWDHQWLTDDVIKFLDSQGFYMYRAEDVYVSQKNIIFLKKGRIND